MLSDSENAYEKGKKLVETIIAEMKTIEELQTEHEELKKLIHINEVKQRNRYKTEFEVKYDCKKGRRINREILWCNDVILEDFIYCDTTNTIKAVLLNKNGNTLTVYAEAFESVF